MEPKSDLLLSKRRSSTVVDDIWVQLRRLILSGELPPGSRLVELDIATQTGASQASAREALQRLERDGLVVRRGRSGTFVTEVAPGEMDEVFRIRVAVETAAVRRTARHIRPEQVRELRTLVDRMREAGQQGDPVAMVEYDMAFHHRICAWANHATLMRVWTLLYAQMERFLVIYDALHFADLTQVADSHEPIVAALEAGDVEEAVRRISDHVEYAVARPLPERLR
jgi:DNA-binding GntR family transcriptional regulator